MSKLNKELDAAIAVLRLTREPPWPCGRESCQAMVLRRPGLAASMDRMTAEDYCRCVQFVSEVAQHLSTRQGTELALEVEMSLQVLEQEGIEPVSAQAILSEVLAEVRLHGRLPSGLVLQQPETDRRAAAPPGRPGPPGRAILRVLSLPAEGWSTQVSTRSSGRALMKRRSRP